jgi:UDP-glucose 4-epimerase
VIAAWVLGSHGLLGSALSSALLRAGTSLYEPAERLPWTNPDELSRQLARAVGEFSRLASESDTWEIYWAAGGSSMATAADLLARETAVLSGLLERMSAEGGLIQLRGSFAFASSAGAIYAGSRDPIVTEESLPAPTTDYARARRQ